MLIINPYPTQITRWLRGNLHAHTNQSDGVLEPAELVAAYEALGYDFLAVSDHDRITPLADLRPRTRMVLIEGEEVGGGPHTLAIHVHSRIDPRMARQDVLREAAKQGGITILNHPNWGVTFSHWPHSVVEALTAYTGIEIYNAVIDLLEGSSLATDRWDRILSSGVRAWGFANDDAHHPEDIGRAWIQVAAEEPTVQAILTAIQSGSFYASTGVTIQHLAVEGRTIVIHALDCQRFRFVGRHGAVRSFADGPTARYTPSGDEGYVRIECYGCGDAFAWTQPFWIEA
ncbi:MAG: CehA/McbA family metallohydrolase [Chthonomonadales bacterium]